MASRKGARKTRKRRSTKRRSLRKRKTKNCNDTQNYKEKIKCLKSAFSTEELKRLPI